MSEKTLLKKIEQAFNENYCTGRYKLDIDAETDNETSYVLSYTYETGEVIHVQIDVTRLGEVKFYSHVHSHYISNFNNHVKSVINVLRILFDLIDSNKTTMIRFYEIEPEATEESEATSEPEAQEKPEETTDHNAHNEKRQIYLSVYRDLQQILTYLRKCNTPRTYDICIGRYIRKLRKMYAENKISKSMLNYIESKISMQNVESGIWESEYEQATGFYPSRRYNKNRVDR